MDGYDPQDLEEIAFLPGGSTAERLAELHQEEAHDLLDLLQAGTAQGGPPVSPAAHRMAREIASGIPSPN
ncbi:DUF6417 family protein [Streptomyces sp. NPDC004542]|uniref:DUF6417 family protein n=1 Tax=Streptomyces sp. NPDC004542 TaxID=3154281 RepID=UPI00339DC7FF